MGDKAKTARGQSRDLDQGAPDTHAQQGVVEQVVQPAQVPDYRGHGGLYRDDGAGVVLVSRTAQPAPAGE